MTALDQYVGPIILVAFCTAVGAVFGAWLIGLTIGLGIALLVV